MKVTPVEGYYVYVKRDGSKKIAKRKEKKCLIKKRKKMMKALKRAQKEIRKGILTAINNGQYVCICEYSYDDYNYFDRNKKEYYVAML